MRLGILASHPIQYQAPLFRELARRVDLQVYFAHRQTAAGQAQAGFEVAFEWDVDLLGGFSHHFLHNRAKHADVSGFFGCDTPGIADEIRKGGFDAFLVMGWSLKSYWQAIRACRKLGVPVMVRGDSQLGTPRSRLKQTVKKIVYPRLLGQFDACLYVGSRNRDYLEHYGVPDERLFFSPHCVDTFAFAAGAQSASLNETRSRLQIPKNHKVALFVGKLLNIKRPFDLIHALHNSRCRGMNVCAAIAGDGPLLGQLQAYSDELSVPVVFLGFRNQTELPAIYAAADVLALTSESETWGLVVNESLACGTPVVVSDAVGCVPDLVKEGQTGAAFPVGDVEGLAAALQRVIESPPPQEDLRSVSDAYSTQAAVKGVLQAMDWLSRTRLGDRS